MVAEPSTAKDMDGWTSVGDEVAGTRDSQTGKLDQASRPATLATNIGRLVGLISGVVAVTALYIGRDVLLPITFAVMLSFILSPFVNLLQRLRIRRVPAVVIAVLAALGVIGALGTIIGTQAAALSDHAPQYASAIQAKVSTLQRGATSRIEEIAQIFDGARKPRRLARPRAGDPDARLTPASGTARPAVLVDVAPPKTTPWSVARAIVEPVVKPLGTMFIVLMVAIFVLMQKEDLRDRFIRVFGARDLHRTTMAIDDAARRLSRYFIAQLAVNTAFGGIVCAGLWLIDIPSPILWGVLAGILRFVPYIGAILAAVVPVALGAAIDPGWTTAILVGAYFLTVESAIGYIVEPIVYGHSTGLSPVSVIISAIFWTWIWGPAGLVLSTPLTLCLVVLGRHVKALEVFDVLLGDRPALTQTEELYQRILANNSDEALAQAETILTECTITQYYDGVMVDALRLAAIDHASGTITPAQLHAIQATVSTVIEDLQQLSAPKSIDATLSVPNVSAGSIACVAGTGPFDPTLAAIVVALLERRGFKPRLITPAEAARDAIAQLDLAGIETIVVCYLELSGSPAELRYLLRRLRLRAPQASLIAGLWANPDEALAASSQGLIDGCRHISSLEDIAAPDAPAGGSGGDVDPAGCTVAS